ncbi:MAG TPA: 4Fe-4S single cluster domain-containing protein [Bacteroidales bacterium]|nr:4Fe-4S single cluster domain-containing protein [Bacteroidales bacterium]
MIWQLNKIQFPIYNLGPGKRIGIWVQGCSICCNGCINHSLWGKNGGKCIDVEELVEFVMHCDNDCAGVSITGGEPFDQYPQLMAFAMMLQRCTKLNVLVYSGYSLRQLLQKFPDKVFTSCVDYLIDGPFKEELPANDNLRGSSNQTIYRFINGNAETCEMKQEKKIWSLGCQGNTVYMAGVPLQNEMEIMAENLLLAGVGMKQV